MARIRTIKPELPHSETLGRVSRDARLLFINLFTIMDDEGRARASSRLLASLLYPFDNDVYDLIDTWVNELESVGAVRRYQVDGNSYIDIPKWLEHQKIDRPSASRLPAYSGILAKPREASPPDLGPRTLDQSLPSEGADAPLKERIFGPALEWLAKQSGKPKDKLRPLVGRWCSKHGDGATLEALAAAAKNAPLDPIPYIERVLKPKAPNGKPDAQASASAHLEGLASIFGTQPMAADRPKPIEQGRVIDGDFRTVGSPETGDGPGIYPSDGGTDRVRGSVRDSMPRAEGGPKNLPRGTKAPAGRPNSSGRGADQGDVGVGQSDADASGPAESGEGGPCGEGDASRAGEGGEIEGPRNIGVKERDCPGEVGSLAASACANDEQPDFDPVADMPDWMRRTA